MTELTPEIIAAVRKFAEEGAKRDDRWLMLVMFSLVIIGAGVAVWYLVRVNSLQRAAHQSDESEQRAAHQNTTNKLVEVLLQQNTQMTAVITRNTDAFATLQKCVEENTKALARSV